MEIKAKLQKPYTETDRLNFIIYQNHNNGHEIKETDTALEAWGYTEEEIKAQQRQQKDLMSLTPADVERALYKAKGMDFDDLKALIKEKMPTIDLKAISIELKAKDFYRGATLKVNDQDVRLIDTIGQLLGYTSDDMDYLFENKELPSIESEVE